MTQAKLKLHNTAHRIRHNRIKMRSDQSKLRKWIYKTKESSKNMERVTWKEEDLGRLLCKRMKYVSNDYWSKYISDAMNLKDSASAKEGIEHNISDMYQSFLGCIWRHWMAVMESK